MARFLGEKFYLFSYVLSHHISRGPGCLQIEAAGDGIDVEHFAGKEEVRSPSSQSGTGHLCPCSFGHIAGRRNTGCFRLIQT